jgi:hypothetical protein
MKKYIIPIALTIGAVVLYLTSKAQNRLKTALRQLINPLVF